MWKRDEAVRPTPGPQASTPQPNTPASTGTPAIRTESAQQTEKDIVNIGKSVVIKGELNGSEDLTVEGHVEGTIQLREHVLTIGPNGRIKAEVYAKAVIVLGEVVGNVIASEKVDIRDNGSIDGDIVSPRVAIAEGAHFRGSVDMQRKGVPAANVAATPTAQPQPAAAAQKPGPTAEAGKGTPSPAPAVQRAGA